MVGGLHLYLRAEHIKTIQPRDKTREYLYGRFCMHGITIKLWWFHSIETKQQPNPSLSENTP